MGGVEGTSTLASSRTFLLLERPRGELRARLRQRERLVRRRQARRRYEDLCLAIRLTRVQREALSDSIRLVTNGRTSPEAVPAPPIVDGGLPQWATTWGRGCLFELESDLNLYRLDLGRTGRWLFSRARRTADTRAAQRLDEILDAVAAQLRSDGISPPDAPPRDNGAAPVSSVSLASALAELNEATYERLRALGLSVTQARRVLVHRERSGGFRSVDELDEIPGLSRALLEELKQVLTV